MKLILVRHAIAELRESEGGSQPEDHLRALTPKGRRRMRSAAAGLVQVVSPPDLLATSPLVRATETAAILAQVFDGLTPVSVAELQPGGGPEAAAAWLRRLPPGQSVMAVGHEPDLGILATYLVSSRTDPVLAFKKGGACQVTIPDGIEPGSGTLDWLLTPRQLRRLGD